MQFIKNLFSKALGRLYYKLVLPKHLLVSYFANKKRGFPARGLKVIGVTGTNGKTSTCFLIHSLLKEANYKVGLVTTVGWGSGDRITPQIAHMTTQPINVLLDRIIKMKKDKIEYLVLEVTSHALAQFRIMGIPIDIAVFTNITHEHLDYHGNFKNYLKAKTKLFKLANTNKNGRRLGIINADDEHALAFANVIKNSLSYSKVSSNDLSIARPSHLKLDSKGSRYTLKIDNNIYNIVCNLPGSFNVENSMAAILTARALGLNKKQIEDGIQVLKTVEGRMTSVNAGQDFSVIIDFAHTPDSFEKLFKDLRPIVKGKIITLFGSAGRRDKTKRAIQGEIAAKYADILVLTEEDDRDENGLKILEDIAQGAKKQNKQINKDMFLILNRTKAIKHALSLAKSKEDLVILLGKGHEKNIARSDGEHDWDEIKITKECLKKILAKN